MKYFGIIVLFALFAVSMAATTVQSEEAPKKDLQTASGIGLGFYGYPFGLYGGYGLGIHRLGLLGLGYGGFIG